MGNQSSQQASSKVKVELDSDQYQQFLKFQQTNTQPNQSQQTIRQPQQTIRQPQQTIRQPQQTIRQSHPRQQSQQTIRQSQQNIRQPQQINRQQTSHNYNSNQNSQSVVRNNIPIHKPPQSTSQVNTTGIKQEPTFNSMTNRYNEETFNRSFNSKCSNEYQPRINVPQIHQNNDYGDMEMSYQERYQSRTNIHESRENKFKTELSKFTDKYDPYEVLSVSKNCSLEEVSKIYKKLAKKAHPDRGGNKELFDVLTKSYMYIVDEIKKSMDKTHYELKENNEEYSYKKPEGDFNINKFNELYSKFKLDDNNDAGYGNIMQKSSATRDDLSIDNIFSDNFNLSVFNTVFDNIKDDADENNRVIVYQEPEAIQPTQTIGYSTLDDEAIHDYGKNPQLNQSNQLQYTDYKKAHTQKLINTQHFKKKMYRNIEELEKDRDQTKFEMTSEERLYYDNKKKQKEIDEYNRKENIRNRNLKIQSQFKKINQHAIHF